MSTSKPPPIKPRSSFTNSSETSTSSARTQSKYVATACESCKKAKRKCDGRRPCQTCVDKGVDCIYNEARDGRRGRKRTLDDLHAKVEAFDTLLDSIRSTSDEAIAELIKLIRNEASISEIAQYAQTMLRNNSPSASRDRARSAIMSIANLTDEPPIRVPAKPWTRVSDDDDFVSHLISVFFTWHRETYPCVDEETFIRAMTLKDPHTEFCSPFLVNCMLMTACLYTDHPYVFASDHDKSTRGLHFADEVARLWTLEEGKVSLTNLQGLVILSFGLAVLRKDRLAMIYARNMPVICNELGRKVQQSVKKGRSVYATEEYQRSLRLARWSAFSMEVDVCLIWARPLQLSKPRIARPYVDNELELYQEWRPYPKTGPSVRYHKHALRKAKFDLREIGAEIVPILLSGDPGDSPSPDLALMNNETRRERSLKLLEVLSEWHAALPSHAAIDTRINPAWSLVELHLIYLDYRIVILGLIIRNGAHGEQQRRGLLDACNEVANIFKWVENTLGAAVWCAWGFQTGAMAAYSLLNLLDQPGVPETFHTIITSLLTVARRLVLARGVMKMLWITLQDRDLVEYLQSSTVDTFKFSAVEKWGPDDHQLFKSCIYPNYAVMVEQGRELADMGDLLEEWASLAIDESS